MSTMLWQHLLALSISFVSALVLVPIMIYFAKRLNLLDVPDGRIKQHKAPTPYLGGLAVYGAFLFALVISCPSLCYLHVFEGGYFWFFVGITSLLLVGLIDDFNVLTPLQKLVGQFGSVLCLLKAGLIFSFSFFYGFVNVIISGFWMLSVINAFNLVDVMDGLSSLLAIIGTMAFLIMALFFHFYVLSLFLCCFLGALLAFFLYNKPPARIYLGDAGSLFLGGFLAVVPLLIPWRELLRYYEVVSFTSVRPWVIEIFFVALVPILFVGIPLLEVVSLIVIRKYHGLRFYSGSPHHFSSYLRKKGWSHWLVLLFAGGSAGFLALIGLSFVLGGLPFYFLFVSLLLFFIFWMRFVFW